MVTLGFALPYDKGNTGTSEHLGSLPERDPSAQPCSQIYLSISGICSMWPMSKAFETEDLDTNTPSHIAMYHLTEGEASLYETWNLEDGSLKSGLTSVLNQSSKRQDPTYEEDRHTIRDPPSYTMLIPGYSKNAESAIEKVLENAIVGGVCGTITQFISQSATPEILAQLASAGSLTSDGGFQPLRSLQGTPMLIIILFL